MSNYSQTRLAELLAAADALERAEAALDAAGENVVSPLFEDVEQPILWDHYPEDDVRDWSTHAQFFYHSHDDEDLADRESGPQNEHGHFHTFLRAAAMPDGASPAADVTQDRPEGEKAIAHLIGVSMTPEARATHLFTVNRWVTGESFYDAATLIPLLDRFRFEDVKAPFEPTARWLEALLCLYREEIAELLIERDVALARTKKDDPDRSPYERRELEVISLMEIDPVARIAEIHQLTSEQRKSA